MNMCVFAKHILTLLKFRLAAHVFQAGVIDLFVLTTQDFLCRKLWIIYLYPGINL